MGSATLSEVLGPRGEWGEIKGLSRQCTLQTTDPPKNVYQAGQAPGAPEETGLGLEAPMGPCAQSTTISPPPPSTPTFPPPRQLVRSGAWQAAPTQPSLAPGNLPPCLPACREFFASFSQGWSQKGVSGPLAMGLGGL